MADREKKERVIHTRVSESLDEELKEKAASLGLSVSNLVRNVLQNTLGLVEDIVADSASVARSARGEAVPKPGTTVPASGAMDAPVIGWQSVVLNINAICVQCNDILVKGADAAIGLTDRPGPKPVLCPTCMAGLRKGEPDGE
ncbi:MAG TPA: hypothetical protein VML75_00950 [Kofleriaceae bacterium]|nr:hypothetical protein [Kofleriaceae bacterium]